MLDLLCNIDISQLAFNKGFPCGSAAKEYACNVGDLGWEDPMEKGKATHSSIMAWRIPWTIQSLESQKSWIQLSAFHFTLAFNNHNVRDVKPIILNSSSSA